MFAFPDPVFMAPYPDSFTPNSLRHLSIDFVTVANTNSRAKINDIRTSLETFIENAPHLEFLQLSGIRIPRLFSYKFFKALVLKTKSPPCLRGIQVSYLMAFEKRHTKSSQELTASLWLRFLEKSFTVSQFCGIVYKDFTDETIHDNWDGISLYIDLTMLQQLCFFSELPTNKKKIDKAGQFYILDGQEIYIEQCS